MHVRLSELRVRHVDNCLRVGDCRSLKPDNALHTKSWILGPNSHIPLGHTRVAVAQQLDFDVLENRRFGWGSAKNGLRFKVCT